MKQATGYFCTKCQSWHFSKGNWSANIPRDKVERETKLYNNHRKFARSKPC